MSCLLVLFWYCLVCLLSLARSFRFFRYRRLRFFLCAIFFVFVCVPLFFFEFFLQSRFNNSWYSVFLSSFPVSHTLSLSHIFRRLRTLTLTSSNIAHFPRGGQLLPAFPCSSFWRSFPGDSGCSVTAGKIFRTRNIFNFFTQFFPRLATDRRNNHTLFWGATGLFVRTRLFDN